MSKYAIPCPYPHNETVPDYHPLTEEEILDLLNAARDANQLSDYSESVTTISDIQVRLNQGIVGIICPRPIDGPLAWRLNAVDSLYMEYLGRIREREMSDHWLAHLAHQFDLLLKGMLDVSAPEG